MADTEITGVVTTKVLKLKDLEPYRTGSWIARQCGVSRARVHQILKKHGLSSRGNLR